MGSPLSALLARKLSKRSVVLLGVSLSGAGTLATSFVPALGYGYLTYGLLVGLSSNLMIHPSMSLLLDWFSKKDYARASSIVLMGSTAGKIPYLLRLLSSLRGLLVLLFAKL